MDIVNRLEKIVAGLETGLLVAIILGMVMLSFVQVVLRLFFHGGFLWADPFLRHLVLWVGFLGAALAALERKHFGWETASNGPGKIRAALRLLACLATMVVAVFLIKASWDYLGYEKSSGDILMTIGSLNVPSWIFACAIPGGFGLILFHTLLAGLRESLGLFRS